MPRAPKIDYGLPAILATPEVTRPTWYYHPKHVKAYIEKYAHLMPIVDHASSMVSGWALGDRLVTNLAVQAWKRMQGKTLIDYGVDFENFILHQDQNTVFTRYRWAAQLVLKDHMRVTYALKGPETIPRWNTSTTSL